MEKSNEKLEAGAKSAVEPIVMQGVSQPVKNADGLFPCPFCKLYPSITFKKYGKGIGNEAYIYHDKPTCPVTIKTRIYKKKETVVKMWNKWVG